MKFDKTFTRRFSAAVFFAGSLWLTLNLGCARNSRTGSKKARQNATAPPVLIVQGSPRNNRRNAGDSPCRLQPPIADRCHDEMAINFDCPRDTQAWGADQGRMTEAWCRTSDGVRHGPYRMASNAEGRTIVRGCYDSGKRDGVWRFLERGGGFSIVTYVKGTRTRVSLCDSPTVPRN
jgi:hypothetical protein